MKRIEAFVRSELAKDVVEAITKKGVGGVTLIQSLGRGMGERPWIGGDKGHQLEFNAVDVVITITEDSKVDSVISAINNTAYTGEKGDGMIFVTEVVDAYDISNKTQVSKE